MAVGIDFYVSQKSEELKELLKGLDDGTEDKWVIERGVLVDSELEDYATNFGLQWNSFPTVQVDSQTGASFSRSRLIESSGWDLEELEGRTVLEIGAGAGRFTEILEGAGATVVAVDLSTAIYANRDQNETQNVAFIRSSYESLAFLSGKFDFVLVYGVAQHVPNPRSLYLFAASAVKLGGRLSIDHYKKIFLPSGFYHPKYFWRPIAKKLSPELLLRIVRWYIPKWLPIDTAILKLLGPRYGDLLKGLIPIPCWNYWGIGGFPQDKKSLETWAILDTFDALGAAYDQPIAERDLVSLASELGLKSFSVLHGGNGLVLNGIR